MTEKTRLLKSAIDEIDRVLLGNKSLEVNEVYLNNAKRYIEESMTDHQPTFEVGEYYSFTTYRKDYDADTTFIFKTLESKNSGVRVIEYDNHGKELGEYVYDVDSDFLKEAKPATAEEVAEFKRAEHFASKGRKLDEFRVGDLVNCSKLEMIGGYHNELDQIICSINELVFKTKSSQGITCVGMKTEFKDITLIQTAEELQEVEG